MNIINRFILVGTLLISAFSIMAQAPAGYYDSLEGKSGASLKSAVKAIAKKGHHAISYGDATWNAFKSTDVRNIDGKDCWWDMYSSNNVAVSSGHPGMNIEHTVANSWWGGTKNDAYKDIVHLNPSNSDANSKKGNYPIGEISGASTWNNGITFIGHPVSGQGGGCTMVYEPHDMYKGDFARVFMYMFVAYDDITWKDASSNGSDGKGRMYNYSGGKAELQPWAYNMMLAWSANDPVSEKEINRNNGIHKEQGNRNPFIDLPDLADYIWGSKKNEAYHLEGSHTPDPTPGPGDDPDPDDPTPDDPNPGFDPSDKEGKYMLVNNSADLQIGEQYIIISPDASVAMSINPGNKNSSLLQTDQISITNNTIENVPDETAIITLEADSNGYLLHLYDINGKNLGYLASASAKTLNIVPLATDAGTHASISVNSGVTTINYGAGGYLKYNKNDNGKMFRTYTSGQEDVALYRFIPKNIASSILPLETGRFRVIIKGNSIIAPEGSLIFDLNGRQVNAENLEKGVYVVVSPERNKTVKAMVGF
ncbi:MAG: endonuclease [Muribaculaceae bacterium]|nr:endonuclease [Muribaculaceae bacterium]